MELIPVLQENREVVLRRWFDRIVRGYPRNASAFLADHKDRFRNPVGHAISEAVGPIFDQVIGQMDDRALGEALDPVVRIRSVQDFSASQAVAFVFELKGVIREVLDGGADVGMESDALAEIDARIDRVALLAFDRYSECREQMHRIRANEVRARWERMLERQGRAAPVVPREERVDE